MKVFVAGASGALGLPLVHELVSRGHNVTGMTRSKGKVTLLEQLGAKAVIADALDAPSLLRVISEAAPTHIVDLLTAFPDNGPIRPRDMVATNELRTRGTANLLQAAIASEVHRIVGESYFAVYGYGNHGDQALSEDAPLQEQEPNKALQVTIDALRSLQTQLLEANVQGQIETIILRFGSIYGSDNPGTKAIFDLLRRRRMPLVRGANGLIPFLHTTDAARAIIAALEIGRPGAIYNIVDDAPNSFNQFVVAAAQAIGAPPPPTYPRWLMRVLAPGAVVTGMSRIPLSNTLAKRELAWKPQYPNYHEGLEQVVQQMYKPETVESRAFHQAL